MNAEPQTVYRPAECAAIERPALNLCPLGTLPAAVAADGFAADCSALTRADADTLSAGIGLFDQQCAEDD